MANQRLQKLVADVAEAAVSDKMQDISATPRYLMAQDLGSIQVEFRSVLQLALSGWGLGLVETVPPTRQYPQTLAQVLYDVRLGATAFKIKLDMDRARAMHELGLKGGASGSPCGSGSYCHFPRYDQPQSGSRSEDD